MPTRNQVSTDITTKITSKTNPGSITNAEDGANRELILDYIDQQVPYFTYAVLVSQSSTNAPINNSVKNNTGLVFTWSRTTAGEYLLTCGSSLSAFICISHFSIGNFRTNQFTFVQIADSFRLRTYDGSLDPVILSDGLMSRISLKIELYF